MLIPFATKGISADRWRGLLERTNVVDGLPIGFPIRIFEFHATPLRIRLAFKSSPRVLDQGVDVFRGVDLLPDADDFDLLHRAAQIAGVVALAQAESVDTFRGQSFVNKIGAAGKLFKGACCTDFEARG